MNSRYLSVVATLLWPASFETITKDVPDIRWWATNVCLRSLTLAFLIPAIRKYRVIEVRIFLIKRGRPVLVTKTRVSLVLDLFSRYFLTATSAALFRGTVRSGCD